MKEMLARRRGQGVYDVYDNNSGMEKWLGECQGTVIPCQSYQTHTTRAMKREVN